MPVLIPIFQLVVFLPLVVLWHRVAQQRADRRAGHRVPTQGIAVKSVFSVLLLSFAGLAMACAWASLAPAWALWTAIILCGLGYCYWSLICLTESGRRYMIAELVAANPGITAQAIVSRYNRKQIIASRLDRLEHWGTLLSRSHRLVPRPTFMLTASVQVRRWARLLGFEWADSFGAKPQTHNPTTQ